MLQSLKHLYSHPLASLDGDIGHVKDFYFDDHKWTIRYLVVDTGSWLSGRMVLISPLALGTLSRDGKALRVRLTRRQIEDAPPIESHKPISRQHEEEFYRYYGWPYYWNGNATWGMSGVPILDLPPESSQESSPDTTEVTAEGNDTHLRSAQAVKGYAVQARDGTAGHIVDFLMDVETWTLQQIIIKVGHRLTGHEVLLPVREVRRISYVDSSIFVDLPLVEIEAGPRCDLDSLGMSS